MRGLFAMIETFHFLRPLWFLAIIPLAFVIWRMSNQALNHSGWTGVIDEALLPHVLISKETRTRTWPKYLLSILGLLSILALAGPVWEQLPQPVYRNQSALVIALDLSRSMDAADLKPSRLVRARFKIADLLKQRKDGQTALLAYAADAYAVTPLTDDVETILSQLKALSTDLMPQQGSRADRAMEKASELLKQAGVTQGDILLITDGVKADRDTKIAAEMKHQGYRIHVLGMGTKEGAPIPDPNGGFLSDDSGNIILPVLDEPSLKAVAKAGHGIYQKYTISDHDIDRLTLQLDKKPEENQTQETKLKSDQWYEEGPWILLLIVPLAAFAFRKGYLVILVFCLAGSLHSPESFADENLVKETVAKKTITSDLWKRPDQKAEELLKQGDAKRAAELFENPRWKGSAQYKLGEYEAALKSWRNFNDADALYNKGNALAKMGKLKEALKSYKESLQARPDFDDAQYNYDQVKKALEEQKKQDQKNNKKKDDQKNKSEQSSGGKDSQADRSKSENSGQNSQQQSSPEKSRLEDEKNGKNKNHSDQQNKPQNKSDQKKMGKDQTSGEKRKEQEGEEQEEKAMTKGEADSHKDES